MLLETSLYSTIFSSKYILKELLKDFNNFDLEKLKELVFIELRRKNPYLPDYVYKNLINSKEFNVSFIDFILNSLEQISKEFLIWERNNLYIKKEKFSQWQDIITLVPPLQILTYFFYQNKIEPSFIANFFSNKYSSLPSYNDKEIEFFINGNLIELHNHLNGTSETEYIWIDALSHPNKIRNELKKSYHIKEVRELYKQFDISFSPDSLYRLLILAKRIRETIVSRIKNISIINYKNIYDIFPISNFNEVPSIPRIFLISYHIHPYEIFKKYKNPLVYESLFLYDSFNYLKKQKSIRLGKLFYIYLLIKSVLNRFLVQQLDQYGFDQFQKITLTELREFSEKDYKIRFLQLNSFYGSQLKHLEGRFAPKTQWLKLKKLVDKIIEDYEILKNKGEIKYTLSLVAHFIKKPDNRKPKDIFTYRHYKLRQELKKQAINLWNLFNWNPKKYLKYIKGIDAAANELHAPPEVFAPIFRFLRRRLGSIPKNIRNQKDFQEHSIGLTFHAGEDFIHIVSGIRYIFEAVQFLDMSNGDRIGHATAVGIDPEFWIEKIGDNLNIKKGEWLDNLIFIYYMIRDEQSFLPYLHKIEKEIGKYFYEIYKEKFFHIDTLINAYFYRSLDPEIFILNNKFFIYPIDEIEKDIEKITGIEYNKRSLELYKKYHQGIYINEYEKIISVKHTEIIGTDLIKFLQNKIIKLINSKGIAIETMPTSNVRISFYENYEQHHIYRWLKDFEEMPTLVLCSDDPGIFSTNLRNEFLFVLKDIDKEEKQKIINMLLQNSEIYKF